MIFKLDQIFLSIGFYNADIGKYRSLKYTITRSGVYIFKISFNVGLSALASSMVFAGTNIFVDGLNFKSILNL